MSYDIRVMVKVDTDGGDDLYAEVAEPELSSPTYNLRNMFVNCMDWGYSQHVMYPASLAEEKLRRGMRELSQHPEKYLQYEAPNGWGTLDGAQEVLRSAWECIMETSEDIPIEHLWFTW